MALLPFASPALAEGFSLVPPIDCDLASDACYIQQYMDRDEGPNATDYTCSSLTYDGHKGTDFALPTQAAMEAGVQVLAAAEGVVAAVRDGMPDTGYSETTRDAVEGRECGNGVLIRHEAGYETQYCHLRQGSIRVARGTPVVAGTPLGLVGQSGRAQFPHVHLSVRKDGEKVDPFDPDGQLTCGGPGGTTLWADPPFYQPGGLLDLGFSSAVPDYSDVRAGRADEALRSDAPAMVLFALLFGTQKGDRLELSITGPEGEVIAQPVSIERTQAQSFRAVGRKLRGGGWPAGDYVGLARLIRAGKLVDSQETLIRIAR